MGILKPTYEDVKKSLMHYGSPGNDDWRVIFEKIDGGGGGGNGAGGKIKYDEGPHNPYDTDENNLPPAPILALITENPGEFIVWRDTTPDSFDNAYSQYYYLVNDFANEGEYSWYNFTPEPEEDPIFVLTDIPDNSAGVNIFGNVEGSSATNYKDSMVYDGTQSTVLNLPNNGDLDTSRFAKLEIICTNTGVLTLNPTSGAEVRVPIGKTAAITGPGLITLRKLRRDNAFVYILSGDLDSI